MATTVNLISLSSQSSHLLDNHTISSTYHGNSGRAFMKLNQEIKKGQWADEIETVDTENFVGHNQLHQEY